MNVTGTLHAAPEKHVDYTGAKMGMWLFLFTEILFFGGLFLLYAVYRSTFAQEFYNASAELDKTIGAINTAVLITSSLTMALSITAIRQGAVGASVRYQLLTCMFALLFLIIKFFEWKAKFIHGIYPGSESLLTQGQGKILFYSLYFVMTGIHGIHVIAGIVIIAVITGMTMKGKIHDRDFVRLENTGLYWHFVDVVWVYLFPLLYLIG